MSDKKITKYFPKAPIAKVNKIGDQEQDFIDFFVSCAKKSGSEARFGLHKGKNALLGFDQIPAYFRRLCAKYSCSKFNSISASIMKSGDDQTKFHTETESDEEVVIMFFAIQSEDRDKHIGTFEFQWHRKRNQSSLVSKELDLTHGTFLRFDPKQHSIRACMHRIRKMSVACIVVTLRLLRHNRDD